jgi:hypothetical protein
MKTLFFCVQSGGWRMENSMCNVQSEWLSLRSLFCLLLFMLKGCGNLISLFSVSSVTSLIPFKTEGGDSCCVYRGGSSKFSVLKTFVNSVSSWCSSCWKKALQFAHCTSHITHYSLLIAHYSLLIAHYSSFFSFVERVF